MAYAYRLLIVVNRHLSQGEKADLVDVMTEAVNDVLGENNRDDVEFESGPEDY